MKIHTVFAVLALSVGGAAFAQAPTPAPKDPMATPRVDAREANQEKRIQQGTASGQLTPKEAAHLEKMQDKESKAIYRQKHDGQRDMDHDGKRDHKRKHSGEHKRGEK